MPKITGSKKPVSFSVPEKPPELLDPVVLKSDFMVGSYYTKGFSMTCKVTYYPLQGTVTISPDPTVKEFIAAGMFVMAAAKFEKAFYQYEKDCQTALMAHNSNNPPEEIHND